MRNNLQMENVITEGLKKMIIVTEFSDFAQIKPELEKLTDAEIISVVDLQKRSGE